MSKRFRLLIIVILIGIGFVFLFPTINWHFLIPGDEKLMATSTNDQIKRYAEKQSSVVVNDIIEKVNQVFAVTDLKDPAGLLKKLKEAKTDVTQLVRGKFTETGKNLINNYSEKSEVTNQQKELLVEELNRLLMGKLIYDPNVFADVELSKPTREQAERNYKKDNSQLEGVHGYLNRFLLEEAFSSELHEVYLNKEYNYLAGKVKEYYKSIKIPVPPRMTIKAVLNSFGSKVEMLEAVEEHFRNGIYKTKDVREQAVTLGLDLMGGIEVTAQANFNALPQDRRPQTDEERAKAIDDALEILNNRIDRFGITEPEIRKQGNDRITISLPGLADPERIKSIILGKGRLNFHIVDPAGQQAFKDYYNLHPGDFLREGDALELKDPDILPVGTVLREVVEKDKYGIDQRVGFAVLKEEIGLEGSYIVNAIVNTDPRTLQPTVNFELNKAGSDIFDKFTNEHIKEDLAVVLDDKVKFQATIQDRISGGRVQVSGYGLAAQEASDLARVLKTGALPVPLEIGQQQAIGASLGADSIRVGLNAVIVGLILVIVFMFIYYKGGGVIANLALVLNFFFMAAILSAFRFTLTLPSIAGFILTVGMAVDANVIIFERIKEEYKLGKSRKASIKAGFAKALWTIMDANITTGIAALALAYFGKGTIKGFAVVLVTGIVCSMFTALFVARLLFDFVTDVFKANKLSLNWSTGGNANE